MSPTSMPRQQQEPGSGRRGHEAQTTPSPRESSLAPARLSFPVLCWLEQPQASPDTRGGDGGRAVPPTLQAGFQKHIRMKENSPPLRGCWHGLTSPLQHLGPREPQTLCLEHSLVTPGEATISSPASPRAGPQPANIRNSQVAGAVSEPLWAFAADGAPRLDGCAEGRAPP